MRKKIVILSAIGFTVSAVIGLVLLFASGSGSKLPVTGQTTQYAADDDGALKKGTDFPSTRFCDNGDNTVTDNMTGLMWTKNANLAGMQTWANALTYVSGTLNGSTKPGTYSDWRLPSVDELKTLVHYAQTNPAAWLGTQGFTNVQASFYWSSTTYASNTTLAWVVGMNVGLVTYNSKANSNYVWPVRGGER
jgi:hypothetical protein